MDNKPVRKYFAQIPNMIDDADISASAYRLYGHIKRVAGDDGVCWQSLRTLAKTCHIAINTVRKAKDELVEQGFISIEVMKTDDGYTSHRITVVNIWNDNEEFYSVSNLTQGVSNLIQGCAYIDTKEDLTKKIKEDPIYFDCDSDGNTIAKKKTKKEKVTTDGLFDLACAMAEVSGMSFAANKSRIFREARELIKDDRVSGALVRILYSKGGLWYLNDWRGQKGDPPKLAQIRETMFSLKRDPIKLPTISWKTGRPVPVDGIIRGGPKDRS